MWDKVGGTCPSIVSHLDVLRAPLIIFFSVMGVILEALQGKKSPVSFHPSGSVRRTEHSFRFRQDGDPGLGEGTLVTPRPSPWLGSDRAPSAGDRR